MKTKFKSAEEKKRYLDNQRSWEELNAKYKPKSIKSDQTLRYSLSNPPGRERLDLPSRNTPGGSTAAREHLTYSGDKIIGIGMMHKSNLVPIMKQEDAKDIASMRR